MDSRRRETTSPLPEVKVDKKTAHVLGKAFWQLVRLYEFSRDEQAMLLGVSKDNRARLNEMEKANRIPVDPDKFNRVGNLLGIHKNLKIIFPHNNEVVYSWMKTPHELFNDKAAIEFIKEDAINSLARIFTVRRRLDQIRCGY